jgi:hypothetical protein
MQKKLQWPGLGDVSPECAGMRLDAKKIDFVGWVFNSSAVLRECAIFMEQNEG